MPKIAIVTLLSPKKFGYRDGEKLRGYIGNRFKEETLFHNHIDTYTFNYESSKIGYKVIDDALSIVALGEGAEVLSEKFGEIQSVKIEDNEYKVTPKLSYGEFELKIEEEENYSYRFITPWFALNQENHKRYRSGELDLNKQLRNNIIEFFKLNGVWADREIKITGEFKEVRVMQKDTKVLGFLGEFKTNVKLPNYIGLGKRKSIGYGTIKEIKE